MGARRRRKAPSRPREVETVVYEIGRRGGEKERPPRAVRPPRPPRVEILREEAGWTAVRKPAGLATVRERWDPGAPTALSLLHDLWRRRDPAAPIPFVVHRLDKETSGLVLFGRDRETARALSEAFRRRKVRKEYLALVLGSPPEPTGSIEVRLLADPGRKGAMAVVRHRGKRSETAWETLESFPGWTLLRLVPRTGRTHQIRVTLAHLGCPVVADPLYGGGDGLYLSSFKARYVPPRDHPERPLVGRLALHAHRLGFDLPAEGGLRTVSLEDPLPRDMRVGLDKLRRFGGGPSPAPAP